MSRSVNQLAAYGFGTIYLAVGILGFTVSGGFPVAGAEGGALLGLFGVNVLHNIVHLLVGVGLIVAATAGTRTAKAANVAVGATYLLVGVAGPIISATVLNVLALNGPDHILHLGSALALLGVGMLADRPVARPKFVSP
ncbi:DUF4383 domain-containing protein [Hoyosella subflava]|uniref:DUF4383 domain-containing protein n=1 Tax=Hoyosella subflava (strain DSM 45089 / JCM 17490 / NBRC 109087 / DQS3-9A1) TaxID=443218 RepID=F6EQ80_HOYSD|nr:DUF4383 domain-containing protein [Hoyosella subflava]AEF39503.1 hypothetical protein AS9A_1051 [Hoyosella subflava DQS3-9A1]